MLPLGRGHKQRDEVALSGVRLFSNGALSDRQSSCHSQALGAHEKVLQPCYGETICDESEEKEHELEREVRL